MVSNLFDYTSRNIIVNVMLTIIMMPLSAVGYFIVRRIKGFALYYCDWKPFKLLFPIFILLTNILLYTCFPFELNGIGYNSSAFTVTVAFAYPALYGAAMVAVLKPNNEVYSLFRIPYRYITIGFFLLNILWTVLPNYLAIERPLDEYLENIQFGLILFYILLSIVVLIMGKEKDSTSD